MKTVILTGSQGFLGTYITKELLDNNYKVIGYDNYSKYGRVIRPHDNHPNFILQELDLTEKTPNWEQWNPDYIILGAALIGGIATFTNYAFDLILQNELILANSYKAVLNLSNSPKRIITISSSMVYEGADIEFDKLYWINEMNCCGPENGPCNPEKDVWPSNEENMWELPSPRSTYGGQKLMSEYWAIGAEKQYNIPYTIIRPFNAIGCYEEPSIFDIEVMSGNIKMLMSHVAPDLIHKCLSGQDPIKLLGSGNQIRCYTNGRDIGLGIRLAMESKNAINQSYNISTSRSTTVLELAKIIWQEINKDKPFKYELEPGYLWDVQKRIPDISKAKNEIGFEAKISLEESVREVIEYMRKQNVSHTAPC